MWLTKDAWACFFSTLPARLPTQRRNDSERQRGGNPADAGYVHRRPAPCSATHARVGVVGP
jgi:hypothetical protein